MAKGYEEAKRREPSMYGSPKPGSGAFKSTPAAAKAYASAVKRGAIAGGEDATVPRQRIAPENTIGSIKARR